jgi:hypothetical protein
MPADLNACHVASKSRCMGTYPCMSKSRARVLDTLDQVSCSQGLPWHVQVRRVSCLHRVSKSELIRGYVPRFPWGEEPVDPRLGLVRIVSKAAFKPTHRSPASKKGASKKMTWFRWRFCNDNRE